MQELYLKKKKFEIDNLKKDISEIQQKIDYLNKKIVEKKETFIKREKENFSDATTLLTKDLFLKSLLKEIEAINRDKKNLEEILDYKKEILSTLLGEKKAFESLKKSQDRYIQKKESENENRLANEIFSRKFYNN